MKEGERLYNAGKYREAAEVLKKARTPSRTPGSSTTSPARYEQAGELREALSYYQQYVGLPRRHGSELLKSRRWPSTGCACC